MHPVPFQNIAILQAVTVGFACLMAYEVFRRTRATWSYVLFVPLIFIASWIGGLMLWGTVLLPEQNSAEAVMQGLSNSWLFSVVGTAFGISWAKKKPVENRLKLLSQKHKGNVIMITTMIVIVSSLLLAYHFLAKPRSYEDCVLENIADASTPQALIVVRDICRSRFPYDFSGAVNPFE